MSSAIVNMPSSTSSASTEHRRNPSDPAPHGFTAVNITPPHSRASSATSSDLSPRQKQKIPGSARHPIPSSHPYTNGHDHHLKRRRSTSSDHAPHSPRRYYSTTHYSITPAAQDPPAFPYDRPYSAANALHNTPESRLSEAFQRDSSEQHYASSANGGDQDRNDDSNDKSATSQNGQKRKRNFSNRTKTGCITCRGRKKKCDEARPHCQNCIRGSFTCQGYAHSRPGSWPKPAPQKQPVPLQSKESDDPSLYRDVETPVSANPTPDTSQQRPLMVADGHDQSRPQYPPPRAARADPRPPYHVQQQHHPQWPQHTQQPQPQPPPQSHSQPPPQHGPAPQPSYSSDHLPPFSELTRPDQQQPQSQPQPQSQHPQQRQDYSTTPHRDMSRPTTQQNPSAGPPPSVTSTPSQWQQPTPQYQPTPPQQQEYGSRTNSYPPRIDTAQPQYPQPNAPANATNTANTGSAGYSAYEQKASSKLFTEKDVERSRMLRGALYNYLDPTLKNERDRCATALARYNKALEWGSGVSPEEQTNMLLKVFDPSLDHTHSFLAICREKGAYGGGTKIERGFRCTYGYNLRIRESVFIGENTRIDDSAKVEIGARTWIGADVRILTNDVAKDMVQRKGTGGQQCSASAVIIGNEVIIGAGAVIFPGVKLGRGSTVEPYAIVKQDLGEYVTQKASVGAQMGGMMV